MLIAALCDYYDILAREGKFVPDGLMEQSVSRLVTLRPDGSIAAIMPYVRTETVPQKNGKTKQKETPRTVVIPFHAQTTKIAAYPLDHRSEYIFGLEWDKDNGRFCVTEKSLDKRSEFAGLNLEYTEGMTSDSVLAFRNFLSGWKPAEHLDDPVLLAYGKNLFGAGSNCTFALDGLAQGLLCEDGQIRRRAEEAAGEKQAPEGSVIGNCAITGKSGVPVPPLHGYIKGIVGTNASGGKLVCFNNPSDESYGKTQSYNSSISAEAAGKYVDAFNYLTANSGHKASIDDMTVVFWAMSDNAGTDDMLSDFFGSMLGKADSVDVNNALTEAMKNARSGISSADLEKLDIDPSVTFYTAGFTPNAGRICMKFCTRSTAARLLTNVGAHQRDMAHDWLTSQPSVWRIMNELSPPKQSDKKPSYPMYSAFIGSVINGTAYPRAMFETVIRRCKSDIGKVSDIRAALIKAYLNRAARLSDKKEVISMALDTGNTSPAYLCGRLFALLEKVQADAIGSANRTIKDAYFSSAATKPSAVFPRLMMLGQHHIRKAPYGERINRTIGEVMDKMGGQFPTTLSTDQQGEFIIGYYQQNKALYTSDKDKQDGKED